MKNITILICLLTLIISCENSGCKDILCTSPPPTFMFELVDATHGENLFTNGVLNSNDIAVVDESSNNVNFRFITENDINIIDISEVGWNLGDQSYTVTVGNSVEFKFKREAKVKIIVPFLECPNLKF